MRRLFIGILPLLLSVSVPAWAKTVLPAFTLTIKDHQFTPAKLVIPANQKVKLIIENQDGTPEEFESYALKREKVVSAYGTITVVIGPLRPGEYKYFGEFNPKTAQGVIVVEE